MSVKSGQAVTAVFTTSHPTTGAATDADSTPTGTLYVNGTADAASVTVTNITTGVYKAAVTLPSLSAGDVVDIRIAATVNSVAGTGVVWSEVADTKRVSDLNDVSTAQVNTEADTALSDINLDHLLKTATAAADMTAEVTDGSVISRMLANGDTSAFDPSTDGLQPIRDQGDAAWATATGFSTHSAADAADAVWNEAIADHTTSTTFGGKNQKAVPSETAADYKADVSGLATGTNVSDLQTHGDSTWATATSVTVSDKTGFSLSAAGIQAIWDALSSALTTVGSIGKRVVDYLTGDAYTRLGAPAGASVSADIAEVKGETASIVADTNEVQAELADGGRTDLLIDAILADTNELQTDDTPTTLATIEGKIDTVDTNVDAILADTGTDGVVVASFTTAGAAAINAQVLDVLTVDVLANSVATLGSRPTIGQALYAVHQFLQERAVSGTTVTIDDPEGNVLMTFTLDDGDAPTSQTRAS